MLEKCVSLWGNPQKQEKLPFEYSRLWFIHDNCVIELEVWSKTGTDSNFGSFKKGTIKNIKIKKSNLNGSTVRNDGQI